MVFPSLGYKTDPRENNRVVPGHCLRILAPDHGLQQSDCIRRRCDARDPEDPGRYATDRVHKEETGDVRRITDLSIVFGDRFSLFCGSMT